MKYSLLFVLPADTDEKDLIKQVWLHLGCCVHSIEKRVDGVFVMFPFDPISEDWALDVDNIGFEGEWTYFKGGLTLVQVLNRYDAEKLESAGTVGQQPN